MLELMFVLLSLFACAGALGMISFHQPSYSALSFIVVVIALSGMFALLNASFLFMVQLIVYAGAVITLLLFIIMFLNVQEESLPEENGRFKIIALGVLVLVPLNLVIYKAFDGLEKKPLELLQNDFGSISHIGGELFSSWILPFELISILLLCALVGSIILALRKSL